MEKNRLTARLALAFTCALLAACANQNVQTDTFASMAEARQRGAVDRGHVPAIVPAGAFELRAAYDTDGSRRWGLFNFRAEDADTLRAALLPEEIPLAGMRMDIPARIEWWPVALRNELKPDDLAATGMRAYRARAGTFVVAVNWEQGRAYYWALAD